MAFCKNCGYEMKETDTTCPACGSAQEGAADNLANTVTYTDAPAPEKASGQLNTGHLIWSILNIIFCCVPLAIVSLIMTVTAKDAPSAAEEQKKLKTAKICNLIATIGGAVFYLCYLALVVIGSLASM